MEALEVLDSATRKALVEYVVRVKHDLGKYVAFQVRWLEPDAPLDSRREALTADLVATRRGPEGTHDAPSVWADLRPTLVGDEALLPGVFVDLSDDPELAIIEREMVTIEEAIVALGGEEAGEEIVQRGTAAALAVADACRELVRRIRGEGA